MNSNIKSQLIKTKINSNRPEKGGSFRRAGKKEGVWGRNFCLPALLSSGVPLRSFPRSRRGAKLQVKLWLSFFEIFFKMSPNLPVKAAPSGKSHFVGAVLPRFLQVASHFLPRDPEVRLRGAQSSAQWYAENCTIEPNRRFFAFSSSTKIPNFRSAGGGTMKATIFPYHPPMLK